MHDERERGWCAGRVSGVHHRAPPERGGGGGEGGGRRSGCGASQNPQKDKTEHTNDIVCDRMK